MPGESGTCDRGLVVAFGMPATLTETLGGLVDKHPVVAGADRRWSAGDFHGAAERYAVAAEAVGGEVERAHARLLLAYCRLETGAFREAATDLREVAVELERIGDPRLEPSLPALIAMQFASSRPDRHVEEKHLLYQVVIDLRHPDTYPGALVNQGQIEYRDLRRPERARQMWEEALSVASDRTEKAHAAYNLGWYWQDQHADLPRANRFYRHAISCAPDSFPAEQARRRLSR